MGSAFQVVPHCGEPKRTDCRGDIVTEPSLAQPEIDAFEAIARLTTPAFVVAEGGRLVRVNDAALLLWRGDPSVDRLPMSGIDGLPVDATHTDRILSGEWPGPPREILVHRFDGARTRALLSFSSVP